MPSDEHLRCRVCGLRQRGPPWGEDGNSPTFEICDCCGVEFGYEDSTPSSTKEYRSHWLVNGAAWFQPETRPPDWNLESQLKWIPEPFR